MASGSQHPDHVGAEQQIGNECDRARHGLLRPAAPELLAHRLGPAPHLHHLGATGPDLADRELALDPRVVEQLEPQLDRRDRRPWPKRWATTSRQCQSW